VRLHDHATTDTRDDDLRIRFSNASPQQWDQDMKSVRLLATGRGCVTMDSAPAHDLSVNSKLQVDEKYIYKDL
jgi:hypothetical protein